MNFRSIRFRMTVWYASFLTILLLVFSGAVYLGLKRYMTDMLSKELTADAKQISETWLKDIGDAGEEYVTAEIEEHLSPSTSNRFVRITRPDGSMLYQSEPPEDRSFDPSSVPKLADPFSNGFRDVGNDFHLIVYWMKYAVKDSATFLIEVGASNRRISQTLDAVMLILGLMLPLGVALAAAGGYALMRRALAPVTEISAAAERITSRNLSERIPVSESNDEIERLSKVLNEMIRRLEDSFSRVVQFTADASHELRTPLTILRGELEVALRENSLNPQSRNLVESVLEETEKLSKTVESLMTLSRLDSGQLPLDKRWFDLTTLCQDTLDQMTLLAEEKQIKLQCDGSERVEVFADSLRTRQIVLNLIDNAIKFTQAGGQIDMTVVKQNDGVSIEVSDNGIGIPHDALPHIFDRFYRADPARARQHGGAGLGLAIVKSICDLHGGTIFVHSTLNQGTKVQVILPTTNSSEFKEKGK